MATFNLSRSASLWETGIGRGMGFRDSNQDVLGFVHLIPDRARQRILDLASTQLSDGSCFHQYQPLTKKGNAEIGGGFIDDHLWLIVSTCAYIKETGDTSILAEPVGYADRPGSSDDLLHHLETGIALTLASRGDHGLPLIGHADWNDCLNLNCFSTDPNESFQTAGDVEGSRAESVMIAGLFLYASRDLARLYGQLERPADEARLRRRVRRDARRRRGAGVGRRVVRARVRRRGPAGRLAHVRRGPDLRREPGLVRARRRGRRERPRAAGPRERARAPLHARRRAPPPARVHALPPRARRDHELSTRLQGERRASSATRTRGSRSAGACSATATARSSTTSRSARRRRRSRSRRTAASRTSTRR